ncbi:g3887 [Coccomyxa viridis]|uniref:G3887 protein n=1 Tax=Coccomyxa viridis TaxID=1274662 RepID=A0ABP1FS60_9CHLO
MADKQFQIVVFGASGFVGKLVAKHLAQDYVGKSNIRWAMAARSEARLEKVRSDLAKTYPGMKDVPILVADATDQAAIDRVVKQTKVVIACSGPYAKLGTPIVDACVRLGAHCVDITGEVPWVSRTIRKYHNEAAAKRVKIVHMCGFDSIPSDLGSLMVATAMFNKHKRRTAKVRMLVGKSAGGFSGGTIASLMGAMFDETSEELKLAADPYALNPPNAHSGPDGKDSWLPSHDKLAKKWTMPFVMQPINTRVVRRSNALLGNLYGDNFSYTEAMEVPNAIVAFLGSTVLAFVYIILSLRFLRPLVMKVLPSPGQGPTEKQQVEGFWNARVWGVSEAAPGQKPVIVTGRMAGKRDPGYWETSRMLLESGLCLALQEDELKKAGKLQGGVLTPASAMGMILVERLNKAGMEFRVDSDAAVAEE